MSAGFNDCIDFSFTPEEFESKWAAFVLKWPVVAGTHFDKLYEYRTMFVPCYFKHRFFPFLQSTQRSEGFNAVLKRYVNPHNSVLNFVKQYEKIQTHVLVREGGMTTGQTTNRLSCGPIFQLRSKLISPTLETFTTNFVPSLS